jgi:hypothetical protein
LLPHPGLIWCRELLDLPVSANYIVEINVGAAGWGDEGEGGVEVRKGAVYEADAGERVGGCEVGGGKGGNVKA